MLFTELPNVYFLQVSEEVHYLIFDSSQPIMNYTQKRFSKTNA